MTSERDAFDMTTDIDVGGDDFAPDHATDTDMAPDDGAGGGDVDDGFSGDDFAGEDFASGDFVGDDFSDDGFSGDGFSGDNGDDAGGGGGDGYDVPPPRKKNDLLFKLGVGVAGVAVCGFLISQQLGLFTSAAPPVPLSPPPAVVAPAQQAGQDTLSPPQQAAADDLFFPEPLVAGTAEDIPPMPDAVPDMPPVVAQDDMTYDDPAFAAPLSEPAGTGAPVQMATDAPHPPDDAFAMPPSGDVVDVTADITGEDPFAALDAQSAPAKQPAGQVAVQTTPDAFDDLDFDVADPMPAPATQEQAQEQQPQPASMPAPDSVTTAIADGKRAELETRIDDIETSLRDLRGDMVSKADFDALRAELQAVLKTAKAPSSAPKAPRQKTVQPSAKTTRQQKQTATPKAAPLRPAHTWTLRAAKPGMAWIAGRGSSEIRTVVVGDQVPGLGTVTAIAQDGRGVWFVRGTSATVRQ